MNWKNKKFSIYQFQGIYLIKNATLVLEVVKLMPLEGFLWLANVKIFKTNNAAEKSVFCVDVKARITKYNRRQ
jgi:hypothetical protein